MWMFSLEQRYQQMQKILRHACAIALFTINRYFTCFEAKNLEKTLTVQKSLNGTWTSGVASMGARGQSAIPDSEKFAKNREN